MELTQDEVIQKYGKNVAFVIEILFFLMNMKLLVSYKATMLLNGNTNSPNVRGKK